MELILPIAGKSSRFPGVKPKWMMTHPLGNMMLLEAIRGLEWDGIERVHVVTTKSLVEKYKFIDALREQFSSLNLRVNFNIVVLEEETRNQPETVYLGIKAAGIKGSIYIKDSDNFFESPISPNTIACFDLHNLSSVNPSNKSYIEFNSDLIVGNIVEKRIISSFFCCGGYGFDSAEEFLNYFDKLSNHGDLYISHIIYSMILDGKIFGAQKVKAYEDWGTLTDWNKYKATFSTLFIDLDGTLVKSSSQYFEPKWGHTDALADNVSIINRLHATGRVQVIITTSRTEEFRIETVGQLKRLNIAYDQIIFGLAHAKRVIINDYAPSNPYKSCDSINLLRDSNLLVQMLGDTLPV